MKLFLKITGSIIIILILAVSALIVFFPKERVKNFVIAKAEKETNMPINLADVGISIWPKFAFRLEGFEIGSANHMLHASFERFLIQAKLRSLFTDDIEISSLFIQRPIIKIYTQHADEETDLVTEEIETDDAGDGMQISLDQIRIENGEIWIFDGPEDPTLKMIGLQQDIAVSLQDEIIHIKGKTSTSGLWMKDSELAEISLSIDKDFQVNMESKKITIENSSFYIQDLPFHMQGEIHQKSDEMVSVDIAIQTEPTQLTSIFSIVPAIAKEVNQWNPQGLFGVEGHIRGDFDLDDPTTSFENSDTLITISMTEGKIKNKTHNVDFSPIVLSTTITPKSIALHNFSLQSQNTAVKASGNVTNYLRTPLIDAKVSGNADLSEAQPWIDPTMAQKLKGQADFEINFKGTQDIEQSQLSGFVNVDNASFFEPTMEYNISDLNVDVKMNEQAITITSMQMNIKDSDFHITNITLPPVKAWLKEDLLITFGASGNSNQINYSNLFPDDAESDDGPLELPEIFYTLKGSATYNVKKLLYSGAEFTNVQAKMRLDRGKVYFEPVSLTAFEGKITLNGLIDFSPKTVFPFDLDLAMKDISVQKALGFSTSVEDLVQIKDSLSAKASITTKADGEMNNMLDLLIPKLNASGKIGFKDANIKNHPIQTKLASLLNSPDIKELNIGSWSQKFKIQGGKIHIEDLNFSAKDFAFGINGYQSLDGTQKFDLKATLPESFKKNLESKLPKQIMSFLPKTKEGNLLIPFNVSGQVTDPSVSFDNDGLQSGGQDAAKQKVKAEIQDRADDVKDQAKESIQTQTAPAKKEADKQKEKAKDAIKEEKKDVKKQIKKLF